jgi:DNA-binding GntR family transcriptional regulator
MMGTIDDQVARLRQQTLGPIENRQQALAAHRKFIDALGKSDADGAEKATHQLLDAAGAYYERIWRGAVSERA